MENRQTERQIRLWALLGPFMILLIFAAYQFKISPGKFYLPLVAVAGMTLCSQGKIKGLIAALFLLIGTLFYTLSFVPIEEKYWYIGLTMATALSFVVTSFSLEEIEQVLATAIRDSDTRLQHIAELDEGKRNNEKKWKDEKEKFVVDLAWEKERLQELSEAVKKADSEAKGLEKALSDARNTEKGLEKALSEAKNAEQVLQNEINSLKKGLSEAQITEQALQGEVAKERKRSQDLSETLKKTQGDLSYSQKTAEQFAVTPQKESFVDSYHPLYLQLRSQFEEKGAILHETRKELFIAQEQAASLQREIEEVTRFAESEAVKTLEREIVEMGKEMERWEAIYREEIEDLHELVSSLIQKQ